MTLREMKDPHVGRILLAWGRIGFMCYDDQSGLTWEKETSQTSPVALSWERMPTV